MTHIIYRGKLLCSLRNSIHKAVFTWMAGAGQAGQGYVRSNITAKTINHIMEEAAVFAGLKRGKGTAARGSSGRGKEIKNKTEEVTRRKRGKGCQGKGMSKRTETPGLYHGRGLQIYDEDGEELIALDEKMGDVVYETVDEKDNEEDNDTDEVDIEGDFVMKPVDNPSRKLPIPMVSFWSHVEVLDSVSQAEVHRILLLSYQYPDMVTMRWLLDPYKLSPNLRLGTISNT
ncbi:hypothetical protein BGX38DRAFT_1259575 [Terfezia claveryi]|nr:hypothetical protein BGX38DRAFT_1259575 [Terfezia claveryi]